MDAVLTHKANGTLTAAIKYHELGWAPLALCPPDHAGMDDWHCERCESPGKRPWHKWKEHQERLPTREEVEERWSMHPNSNVGIALGPVSGLVRVDVDGQEGRDHLAKVSGGEIPHTLRFRSGGGGEGYLFRIPPGVKLKTTSHSGEQLHSEIRFQAQGAQTALPPSIHPSGPRYEWLPGCGPEEVEPALMPAWLVEQMMERPKKPAFQYRQNPPEHEIAVALSALSALSPHRCDDYDEWVTVGMCLHSVDPSAAMLAEWDRWSQGSNKYSDRQCVTKWQSFNGGGGKTIATLVKLAKDDSPRWRPPLRKAEHGRASSPVPFKSNGHGNSDDGNAVDFVTRMEDRPDKPEVVLPGGSTSISDAGKQLGQLLAKTGRYYRRGESVTKLTHEDGQPVLQPVKNAAFPSIFDTVADLFKVRAKGDDVVQERTTCSKSAAELIAHSEAFLQELPPIRLLTQTPILVDRNGDLEQVTGYDRESATYAGAEAAEDIPLDEAVSMVLGIYEDFRFATPSDKSRAIAGTITPALLQSKLLRSRAPVDLGEADKSQTGKGFRNKITAAIYKSTAKTVTQRKGGGVGSLEETFNARLIQGASIISLENIRGKIDSPALESFLTEDNYPARQPYLGIVDIDPRRINVMMTSNRAEFTPDFANRTSCTRLLKQPEGYQFKRYPEGAILDHIRANQPRYLGAVFSIVREWHRQGKPRTGESRHDFREWVQVLDWIVQNILRLAPLMDGHAEAIARTTNPSLTWLRDVALAVQDAGQDGRWLRANHILDIISDAPEVDVPGIDADDDTENEKVRDTALKAIGRKFHQCFRQARVQIDGTTIERQETEDESSRKRKEYRFTSSTEGTADETKKTQEPLVSRNAPRPHGETEHIPHMGIEEDQKYEMLSEPAGSRESREPRRLCPKCEFATKMEGGLCRFCAEGIVV